MSIEHDKPLSAAELAAIRERAEAAHPGEASDANMRFIYAAYEDIVRLLATVDAYRATLEAVVDDADTFGWQSSTIQRACALLGTE